MSDSSVKTWLQWTRAANPPHNSTVDITLTFGRFIRGRNPIWYILNHVMPSPSINIQSFPQKQEKKKVSFAEAYPPPAALSSEPYSQENLNRDREGLREAAFSFTSKPLYTSAVFKLPHSSFQVGRSPSSALLRPFVPAAVPVRVGSFCTGVNLLHPVLYCTEWWFRLELCKLNYSVCCLGDIFLILPTHLPNSIQNSCIDFRCSHSLFLILKE